MVDPSSVYKYEQGEVCEKEEEMPYQEELKISSSLEENEVSKK